MKKIISLTVFLCVITISGVYAADVVPPEIEQPGTQPNEVTLETTTRCLNCHQGYAADPETEPGFGWNGSAMGNAGRDPIFWATVAIAEQDVDGSGDLCIRCHSTGGWHAGRSTPTDGSGLAASDEDGVDCDTCHQMTNPDNSEHLGIMNDPFIANQDDNPGPGSEGYYGSGMLSLKNDAGKLGPYAEGDAVARHQFTQSKYHRDVDFCGSCHDVSNPAVGDLAPGNGAQPGNPATVISSGGNLGGPIEEKAAFNNPPYAYGVVERTFSEYKSSLLPSTLVNDFRTLPADLQDPRGSLYNAYMAATKGETKNANYDDGTSERFFSCQTCHLRATTGHGADKRNAPLRDDLPMHDLTGGNYWLYPLIKYQDAKGVLRLGGGLDSVQVAAMDAGMARAGKHLTQAATLDVIGDTLKVTNMTAHKVISGYPEGRRMWLNIVWKDAAGGIVREDGKYGPLVDANGNPVTEINPATGQPMQVESILNLQDPNTKIYEVHPAMTKEWADTLLALGTPGDLALGYDRNTGEVDFTLSQLAALPAGSYHETFHFVLNNYVAKDNRIPPYGMSYDEAQKRNALPVPDTQYGGAGPGSTYQYWDNFTLNPPIGAVSADITLFYQGTSWEYIQFLYKANNGIDPAQGGNAFLGEEGVNMLDAWMNALDADGKAMVPPYAMATATWGTPTPPVCEPVPEICDNGVDDDCDGLTDADDPDCQTAVVCSDFTNRTDCKNTGCSWDGKTKTCQ